MRRVNVSNWGANGPNNVPSFRIFLLRNRRENFYTLLSYKTFYIILDIIVIHIKGICKLYFYNSCHIKEKCVEFFFFIISYLFCYLVSNENIKRQGFSRIFHS